MDGQVIDQDSTHTATRDLHIVLSLSVFSCLAFVLPCNVGRPQGLSERVVYLIKGRDSVFGAYYSAHFC